MKRFKLQVFTLMLAIQISAGLYLTFFDSILKTFGYIHWLGLIGYLVLDLILLSLLLLTRKNVMTRYIGFFSALGTVAMVADALLGLPVSEYKTTSINAIAYLFGFGASGTGSSFGVSLAFTILLISSGLTAVLASGRF